MTNIPDYSSIYHRNKQIWGEASQDLLWKKHVMVFGLGGVGGHAVEALTRAGIGTLSIVDYDTVDSSNFNRQLLAISDNLNMLKVEAMHQRINSINSDINVNKHPIFYDVSKNNYLFANKIDYVIDAIDSIKPKVDLLYYCIKNQVPVVSSMGTGNRLDPLQLYFADIIETKGSLCPFTKKVRQSLKKCGIEKGLQVLTSKEPPVKPDYSIIDPSEHSNLKPPASTPFVPTVAGIVLAGYVVRKLIESNQ